METTKAAFEVPPPPANRQRWGQASAYVLASVFAGVAAFTSTPLLATGAVPMLALGYLLLVARRQEVGTALATAALDRAARGRFDEARALLEAAAKVRSTHVRMMVDSQRAALALYEGNLETAVAEATKGALEGKRLGAVGRIHQGSALSIRAVALAGLGRKDEALADVASVRGATYRQGAFVARAALAEALIAAREKDLEALATILREERALLFGATGPRERMVVRALSRMVAAKKVSVYREPAKRDEQDLDEHGSWVARIAPEAASYANAPKLGARLEAPEAVNPKTVASAEKAAPKAKTKWTRVAALWAVLIVLLMAIWSMLDTSTLRGVTTAPDDGVPAAPLAELILVGLVVGIGAFAGLVAVRVARARKLSVELSHAMELRLRGRYDEARAAFDRLAKSTTLLVAPQAVRELATIAAAEGDFKTAQQHAEAGIVATRMSPLSLNLSRPVLLPQLHGELAFALAADGQGPRAEEELEKLRLLSPAYPYLARDTFRVRLVALVASGRFEEAAAMARERPADLPLSMQEELLCDALRVSAGDHLPEGERERIELDLREDALVGRFLDAAAPALRSTLHQKRGPRVAIPAVSPSDSLARDDEAVVEGVDEKRIRQSL
jgi:tetratricopeptide (TPR) repeat protein